MSTELFTLAGAIVMALVASVVSLRLIRDESSLRRKRILADKY